MKKLIIKSKVEKKKTGFTIIEVMLVLAITGLVLIGALGGTYRNIEQQRYVDSYRSFAEFLRQMYNEALSPESWSTEASTNEITAGRSKEESIYGKVVVFGQEGAGSQTQHVYSATIVGKANVEGGSPNFMDDLAAGTPTLKCETVAEYNVRWEARLTQPDSSSKFTGTLIIARSPSSGSLHTRWLPEKTFDITSSSQCSNAGGGKTDFAKYLEQETSRLGFKSEDVDICVKSNSSSVVRGIRIASDAHNSSGINMLTEEESGVGGIKCQ